MQRANYNVKVRRNRDALIRLTDTMAYLGMQEQSFRRHDERQKSANKGNYRELVYLIGRYDRILAEHIENSTEIKKEVDTAPFLHGRLTKQLM